MTPEELAAELSIGGKTLRSWLRRAYGREPADKWQRWSLTDEQVAAARSRWGVPATIRVRRPKPVRRSVATSIRTFAVRDEGYVIDLCDEILGEKASRHHRFRWLLGDPGKDGRTSALPVDAYYARHKLVIEYHERQHYERVAFFDKESVLTVSGVHRGEQRRLYDERRNTEIPSHGLRLILVRWTHLDADGRGRLRRNKRHDIAVIQGLLRSETSKA